MSEETQNDIIAYIKNEIDRNENLKAFHIAWFGGEPLLRLDVIKAISDFVIPYCEEKQIQYNANIVTNGYFLTKEVSQQLKDLQVTNVKIAIDGFAEEYGRIRQISKDAYSKVLQNIENSVIPVNIMLNVTRKNTSEIIDLAKELLLLYSVKSGRTHIGLNRVKEYDASLTNGFTDDEWLEFKNQLLLTLDNNGLANKWFKLPTVALRSCTKLGARNVTLCADGYIYRCDNDTGSIDKAIGTVKQGVDAENKVNKQYVRSTITDICRNCKYLPICCGGSCRYDELYFGCKPCNLVEGKFRQMMQYQIKKVGLQKENKLNQQCSMLPLQLR
jgi:uncharacterized protein